MKRFAFALLAAAALGQTPAQADDVAAQFTMKLFDQACVQNFGHLEQVQTWAFSRDLAPIVNPDALAVFLGYRQSHVTHEHAVAGGGVVNMGQAWAVPGPDGHFVLSIRTDPESCIIWAQKADQAEIEAAFKKIVEGMSKPGVQVKADQDQSIDVPDASVHVQVYRFWTGVAETSSVLALASVNRSGGPFQAMIQAQRLIDADDPIDLGLPIDPPSHATTPGGAQN